MRGIVVNLKMGIVIWFIIVYTVNHCIQWTETVLWVEFRVYALSINDMFAIMYNIQFYCISYLRITNNQITLQFSSLSRIPYYLPIIPILISSGIHSISNKQTNKQTNNTSFIYTLCAFRWPHFTISKIPFSYYTSLSPSSSHILIAARLHVLRRQTQQLRPLVSLQHRHQPIVLLRRHLPPTPLPLLPSPRSSAARSLTSATTCTPSSAARSPPPSLPASIPRSDSRTLPAESPSVPPGSVAAAVCV